NLPRTYGIDDFPLCMQTKEFDVLNQIAIATFMDTAIMMNATVNAYQNMPAQVVRLRLLNGASQRSFLVGFSNNMNFSLIGNDGGLLPAPVSMNRLLLSNGERAEILVDLGSMLNDTLYLRCYGSELPNGIYGADSVGDAGVNQIPDYYNNTLNGVDFDLLQIRVVAQTSTPVTSIPTTLIPYTAPVPDAQTQYRKLVIDTIGSMAITPNLAAGPFAFNQELFDMDSINEVVILNSKEEWTIQNKSMIAHPFHIHDIQFSILDVNGGPVPDYEKGKKDVVLIMPGDSVRFITEFKDFANDSIPYMYHCHILHHEDDGMMGSFLVIDTSVAASVLNPSFSQHYIVYPNPANQHWQICSNTMRPIGVISLYNLLGQLVYQDTNPQQASSLIVPATHLPSGMYYLKIDSEQHSLGTTLVRE
ncbi:MAG TPA: multicopper oxidase domain-containing protein, partial [Chitinophagaceae bacterium]|nr:multicopper oxidase domain-containing protein [Chitinophagaceae bacterium]